VGWNGGSAQISIWRIRVWHETAAFPRIKINERALNKCLRRRFENYLNVRYFILTIYLPVHHNYAVVFRILSCEVFLQLRGCISPQQVFQRPPQPGSAESQQTGSAGRRTGLINTLGFPPDIWLLWGCARGARRTRRQAFPSDSC